MKGKFGVSMQGIEYIKREHCCKNCSHLARADKGRKTGWCTVRSRTMPLYKKTACTTFVGKKRASQNDAEFERKERQTKEREENMGFTLAELKAIRKFNGITAKEK